MIILSLEQSNQTIVDNLKERLSDSNAAIVSLLDQSKKYEEQNIKLKSEIKEKEAQSKRPLDEKVNVNESTDKDSLVRMWKGVCKVTQIKDRLLNVQQIMIINVNIYEIEKH